MNMKKELFLNMILAIAGSLLLGACNDYLDETPDNRTEIDTDEKVTKLLVSAYSTSVPNILHELMSDNMTDKGRRYEAGYLTFEEAYHFRTITGEAQDAPYSIWESNYNAIASANTALEAIKKLSGKYDLRAQTGEALLCRAYAHFTLCNAFCQAYNPQSSATDAGIPYVYDVEKTAINSYTRGTVEDVYKRIDDDIEEGLPLIDDNLYRQPKYHFNKRAAYAFAAQFNLYYGNYAKAVDYATKAIGENPASSLRDYSSWSMYTNTDEYTSAWISSGSNANMLLQGINSVGGRMYYGRYMLTNALLGETIQSEGPWSSETGFLVFGKYVYTIQQGYFFPKQMEYFVYTDQVQGTGVPYLMTTPFTVEKTLLDRAEAYTMLREYEKAAQDLSYVYVGSGAWNAVSATAINRYYASASSLQRKTIEPRFSVAVGMQENFIHACLHARRVLTMHEGVRLLDIKRYGIRYEHVVDNEATIKLEPYDKRLALQIPELVIAAGIEANPR